MPGNTELPNSEQRWKLKQLGILDCPFEAPQQTYAGIFGVLTGRQQ